MRRIFAKDRFLKHSESGLVPLNMDDIATRNFEWRRHRQQIQKASRRKNRR